MEKNNLKRVKLWLWLMLIINLVASVALIYYSIKIIPTIVDYYELGNNFVILYVLSILLSRTLFQMISANYFSQNPLS